MRRVVLASVALSVVSVAGFATAAAGARPVEAGAASSVKGVSDAYIVLLDQAPAAAYAGGVSGYRATKPARGRKLDSTNPDVERYVGYLRSRHSAIASGVGATRMYDYTYSLNGFAAVLNKSQVAKLKARDGVVSVRRDGLSQPHTDNTPTFLGLNAPGGIWQQLGGQGSAGEDVIVGVVDTGIWPEHPSFADTGYGPAPAGWHGTCQAGELFSKQECNGKLIGARYYSKGIGHFKGGLAREYESPRDHDGHGSHTASTAAGNANVVSSIFGRTLGTISGMAPRARVAAYKACWELGCAFTDTVAAIDAAVADGVDVINYSIGDGDPDFLDTDDVAFLFARQAGVFVAASAGNDGPDASTVDHGGPWLTTVAASTQNRSFTSTVTLGNGATYTGASVTLGRAATPLVDGAAAGSAGCLTGLDPAKVTGKIVLCEGSYTRAARGLAVKQAGGVGMILYTLHEDDSLFSDNHYLPAMQTKRSVGLAIKAYAAAAGNAATAALSAGARTLGGGNTMTAFSSRGPLLPNDRSTGDLLKPDITAPGLQILAANTPTAFLGAPGQLFQAIGGTSMSSPHIAGIGALLKDRHPDWTPAEMQSAIVTSARQNIAKQDGVTPADPFDFGGGHVVPNRAADPGLVYPVTFDGYRAFLRSQGLCTNCFGTGPAPVAAATDLNVPSLTVRSLAGVRTATRTVKNVGPAGTYTVNVDEPAGVDVAISPSTLSLAAGESATYTITLTATAEAEFGAYTFGSVTWSGPGERAARIPLSIRPVALSAPAAVSGTGTSGSLTIPVTLGYAGPFAALPHGLMAATTEARTVADDPTNAFDTDAPDSNQGIQVHSFTVPSGTPLARFALFDEFTDGEDDLDLYLYRVGAGGALELVGLSGSPTGTERIDVDKPAPGAYKLYVHGWETDGASAAYTLFSWLVPNTAAGNMTVSSSTATATVGGTAQVTAAWSGLTAGTKYLGRISYSDGSEEIGATVISVEP
jgi:subtilisin family serine protease